MGLHERPQGRHVAGDVARPAKGRERARRDPLVIRDGDADPTLPEIHPQESRHELGDGDGVTTLTGSSMVSWTRPSIVGMLETQSGQVVMVTLP